MTPDVSLSSLLENLEAQIATHREREAFHAQREAHHRQHREQHAAELETLTRNLETLRGAAGTAMELASRPGIPVLPVTAPDPDPGRKPRLSRMVALVVKGWPVGQPFGTSAVTDEVARRYRDRLRRLPDPRMVSMHLRRLLAAGEIESIEEGRPHHEALYSRPG
ncbi:MAG: hypothetical protein QOF89_3936 [Acidobacteriota bacterium]|jgi:hypothetical protein|nr:hypothetical protein [Acidobacteriota bacterium]